MDKHKFWVKNVMSNFQQPNIWVCPYLTQIWVVTTQHFLE